MLSKECNDPVTDASLEADISRCGLIAYRVNSTAYDIVTAPVTRSWMSVMTKKGTDRCLPIRMASQYGWLVLNAEPVEVIWHGGAAPNSLEIRYFGKNKSLAPISHFGDGIVTWQLPFLFQTAPGYNLLVTGPTNGAKDGIAPLAGLVETDWSPASFTMNWKITRPGVQVYFDDRDPICMLIPQPRGFLESFRPVMVDLHKDANLGDEHKRWVTSRTEFLKGLVENSVPSGSWQKHYFQGVNSSRERFADHQTRMCLEEFRGTPVPALVDKIPEANPSKEQLISSSENEVFSHYQIVKEFWSGFSDMANSFMSNRDKEAWRPCIRHEEFYLFSRPGNFVSDDILSDFFRKLRSYSIRKWGMIPLKPLEIRSYSRPAFRELHRGRGLACLRFSYFFEAPASIEHQIEYVIQEEWAQQASADGKSGHALSCFRIRAAGNSLLVMTDHTAYGFRNQLFAGESPADCLTLNGFLVPKLLVSGGLSEEIIKTVVSESLASVQLKHDSGLPLEGYVTFRVDIAHDGRVTEVVPLHSQLHAGGEAQRCIAIVKSLTVRLLETRFPQAGVSTEVILPHVVGVRKSQ